MNIDAGFVELIWQPGIHVLVCHAFFLFQSLLLTWTRQIPKTEETKRIKVGLVF